MAPITDFEIVDLRLKCPFSMIVCGPSNCGKATWVTELLRKQKDLLNKNSNHMYWFYNILVKYPPPAG